MEGRRECSRGKEEQEEEEREGGGKEGSSFSRLCIRETRVCDNESGANLLFSTGEEGGRASTQNFIDANHQKQWGKKTRKISEL